MVPALVFVASHFLVYCGLVGEGFLDFADYLVLGENREPASRLFLFQHSGGESSLHTNKETRRSHYVLGDRSKLAVVLFRQDRG